MPSAASFAILGFRPHTYWTAVAAVTGEAEAPRVIARRRIVFAPDPERFVYHQAAGMDRASAPAWIEAVRAAVTANAAREVAGLAAELKGEGLAVRGAVVPTGTAAVWDSLDDILRVHARMHAAEGEFYRDAVAAACAALGLEVRRVIERQLRGLVSQRLAIQPSALEARLKQMGAALGPPWSEDDRLAFLAAWTAL